MNANGSPELTPHKYKFEHGALVQIDWTKARANVKTGGTLKILYPMGPVGFAGGGCCLNSYAVEDERGEIFAADEEVLRPAQ